MKRMLDSMRLAALSVFAFLMVVAPAYAQNPDVESLFNTLNLDGLKSNVLAILLIAVSILVVFVGYKLVRKGASRVG